MRATRMRAVCCGCAGTAVPGIINCRTVLKANVRLLSFTAESSADPLNYRKRQNKNRLDFITIEHQGVGLETAVQTRRHTVVLVACMCVFFT